MLFCARHYRSLVLGAAVSVTLQAVAVAQRMQLPPNYGGVAPQGYLPQTIPPVGGYPPGSIPNSVPGASLGPIQPFDPYALTPGRIPANPSFSSNPGLPTNLGLPAPPQTWPPNAPSWPAPGISTGGAAPYGPGPSGVPAGPGIGINPGAASGYGGPSGGGTGGYATPGLPPSGSGPPFRRLFQDTGFRYTWLPGSDGDELQMHDIEASTTAYFPKFLRGAGPLRVTPGFALHLLDGPSPPITSDLPSQLYSGYVDAGWNPQFSPQFGADVNFRAGVFSDFQTITTDSLRFMGTGVGVIRVTPTTAIKLGGTYIDRAKIKFLPAAGVLWTPNAQTRWDIFFPAPKLASYWTTVGNSQLWWYVAAEYGGGSWTIDREQAPAAGASERIDINDIRVILGIEWQNLNRWYGFVEAGYVFDREVYYVVVPSDRIKLENTFMLRAGISF